MPTFDIDLELDGIVDYDLNAELDFINNYADFDNIKRKNVPADPYANNASSKD